jgi:hypothetical protein
MNTYTNVQSIKCNHVICASSPRVATYSVEYTLPNEKVMHTNACPRCFSLMTDMIFKHGLHTTFSFIS